MIIRTRKNSPSSLPAHRRFRSALRIEELESRHLMSATTSLDNLRLDTTTYSSENILVRWEANAQIGTGNRKFLDLQSGLYRVGIHPGETVDQALKYFQGLPGVDYATPDYEVRLERTPNDPSFANGSLYGMTKIDAPTAWDNSTGSESMIVAVIDSGVDYNHPDLAQNIWTNSGEIPGITSITTKTGSSTIFTATISPTTTATRWTTTDTARTLPERSAQSETILSVLSASIGTSRSWR